MQVNLDQKLNLKRFKIRFEFSAWIGSFSTGFQFFLCIVGSILTDLFNPRRVGVAGGLLSSISLLASAFVTDIRYYHFYSFINNYKW